MTPAEISVLGAILLNNKAMTVCTGMSLTASDFSDSQGKILYEAMLGLSDDGAAIDTTTLLDILKVAGRLESVGGMETISEIIDGVPAAANVPHYVKIVIEDSHKRKLSVLGQKVINTVNGRAKSTDIIDKISTAVDEMRGRTNLSVPYPIADIMRRPIKAAKHIPTGLRAVDSFTGGPALGELWMIGAWPGHGKSALQAHIALRAALSEEQIPVLFFSLEMPEAALKNRFLANLAGVSITRLLCDNMSNDDADRISEHGAVLMNAPIYVQSGSVSIDAIVATSRQMIERKQIKMVIVDYVQIVDSPGATFREQLTTVAHKLLHLAVDSNISVIAASQLRKPSDGRNAEPNEHDLREAGALNDDPHVVALIHRPDKGKWDHDMDVTADRTAIINIAKNRNGLTGCATVAWDGPYMRFFDLVREE